MSEVQLLSCLRIQNLGIVDQVEVNFKPGLNIITGETGAGKSLMIDALSLLRGGRFSAKVIGPFGEQSQVGALFQLSSGHKLLKKLSELDLLNEEAPEEVFVRRVCTSAGKVRNYVNDVPVPLRSLVTVASELIDISSQFESQKLLDEKHHLGYLDSYARNGVLCSDYQNLFQQFLDGLAIFQVKEKRRLQLKRSQERLQADLREIEELDPCEDEFDDLLSVVAQLEKRLGSLDEISRLVSLVSDREGSCQEILGQVKSSLDRLRVRFPQEIEEQVISSCLAAVEGVSELSFGLERLQEQFSASPGELAEKRARLDAYSRIVSRFGQNVGELKLQAEALRLEIDELEALEAEVPQHERTIEKVVARLLELAEGLSHSRASVIRKMGRDIEAELAELGMNKARFQCNLVANTTVQSIHIANQWALEQILGGSQGHDQELLRVLKLSRHGAERAMFAISSNPGTPPRSLKDVASGGELSRLMLSIKKVLFEDDALSVFVFDEIDTGISGSIAARVGQKLAEFCRKRQAIVVTHLPQVACYADEHFVVCKGTHRGRTSTRIMVASRKQREQAIAEMMSGSSLSQSSLDQARQLIGEAQQRTAEASP